MNMPSFSSIGAGSNTRECPEGGRKSNDCQGATVITGPLSALLTSRSERIYRNMLIQKSVKPKSSKAHEIYQKSHFVLGARRSHDPVAYVSAPTPLLSLSFTSKSITPPQSKRSSKSLSLGKSR
jgi:hypothetical protein